MKIIALGDTHGRTKWKSITHNETADYVNFIGDYFDTHEEITAEKQIRNFQDILAYKKTYGDRVILLFGNHDYHYLRSAPEIYSGYQKEHQADIQALIHQALDQDLLQMCFVWQHFLFSHAGITKTWCQHHGIHNTNIEIEVNGLFRCRPECFRFRWGKNKSKQGDDIEQSPIWVRPQSLLDDKLDNYIQIVGHTPQINLMRLNDVIFIDTLGTSGEYLVFEKQKFRSARFR